MKKIIIGIVIVMGMSTISLCQDKKIIPAELVTLFEDGEYSFYEEDYKEALVAYLDLYDQVPENANINFRIGICYLNSYNNKKKAISYLERAVKNTSREYKEGSSKETNAPVLAFLYLGDAYFVNNFIDKAIESYKKCESMLEEKDSYHKEIIERKIETCNNAMELMKKPVRIYIKNIGKPLNTEMCEYNPVLSTDQSLIIYTSRQKFYEGVFYSKKENDLWSEPKNFNFETSSTGSYISTFLNSSGNHLLLRKIEEEKGKGDLFESRLNNNKWSVISKLNANINSNDLETHASITPNGKTMFFTSNRKGSFGKYGSLDIYKSELQENGEWGPAVNIGKPINSEFDEDCPFFMDEEKTLFFSSQGHNNMGGFDLFYSKLQDNGEWSDPVNLGYPMNTTDDQRFFFPVKNGKEGYIYKFGSDSYGEWDIYYIKFLTQDIKAKGIIKTTDNSPLGKVSVKIVDENNPDNVQTVSPDLQTGEFSFQANSENYLLIIEGENYKTLKKNISVNPDNLPEYVLNIILEKIIKEPVNETSDNKTTNNKDNTKDNNKTSDKGQITITAIFFNFDKCETNHYYENLDQLAEYLKNNSDAVIEISGFTCSVGDNEYNLQLSRKRSEFIKTYLLSHGAREDKIQLKFYGEENPIASDICAESRKFNRRVEFKPIRQGNPPLFIEPIIVPEKYKFKK